MADSANGAGERLRGRPRNNELPEQRRQAILDAAVRRFAQRGFAETDLQQLADELGIGKGTVYRYFPTKRELFLAAVERGLQRLRRRLDDVVTAGPPSLAMIRWGTIAYLQFFADHPELIELFLIERVEFRDRKQPRYFEVLGPDAKRDWCAFMQQLMDAGELRPMSPEVALDVIGDLLYGVVLTNHLTGRRLPPIEQAEQILDVVLNGLLPTPSAPEQKRNAIS